MSKSIAGNCVRSVLAVIALFAGTTTAAAEEPSLAGIQIKSSADGTLQPARWFAPVDAKDAPVPLLVLLHTWSGDCRQDGFAQEALAACAQRRWALVQPNFRGPNRNPDACASKLAIADVLDAVDYAKANAMIDETRIYLVGTSGGGQMALVMAHSEPQVWAGVSCWVPVVDLAAWHAETKAAGRAYWKDIEAVCGGPPGKSVEVDAQYRARSPLLHLAKAQGVPIDLNVGIHDGHAGSIPVTHSLQAFNALAEANGAADKQLSDDQMQFMRDNRRVPEALAGKQIDEPDRKHKALFCRTAGPVRLTIFDGGHEGDTAAAIAWLAEQQKSHLPARRSHAERGNE